MKIAPSWRFRRNPKFLLDEGVHIGVADFLRSKGLNVKIVAGTEPAARVGLLSRATVATSGKYGMKIMISAVGG